MSYATLAADGLVSIVTLDRPERLNAIGTQLLADLHWALSKAQADPATRAIVLTGAGRAFCAGDDLKEFGEQSRSADAIAATCEAIQQITRDIMMGPKLVIGAAKGYAAGGGFEWVLNCDMVVAGESLVCFFPEMELGHFVTGGVTWLLPRMLGHQRAIELMVLGERQDADALLRLGIVNRVVADSELMPAALALARAVAQKSTFATSRLKKALTSDLGQLERALEIERAAAAQCFANSETAERVTAFVKTRL
jgi:enoyl-CoA hydratase/carnithine racemase